MPAPVFASTWQESLRDLELLAVHDPDGALKKVAQLQEKQERKAAAARVCLVIAVAKPENAARAGWDLDLGKFADEGFEHRALETLAARWADADPKSALSWALSLPMDEESRRDWILTGIVTSIAQADPPLAAGLVARMDASADKPRIKAISEVLRQWAARDYQAALHWLSEFPPGLFRERGVDVLASIEASPYTGPIQVK